MSNKLVDRKEPGRIEKLADKKCKALGDIYKIRREKYFLPMFSDRLFTICNRIRGAVMALCTYVGFAAFILLVTIGLKTSALLLAGIVAVVVLLGTVGYKRFMNHLMAAGFDLQPEGVIKKDFFGKQRTIAYFDLEQAICNGHMGYNRAGLYIGAGADKLIFHYEKGEEIAQRHLEECYKELKKYIHVELLPYEKKLSKAQEKKRKKIKMDQLRREGLFLPLYSDYYFEKKDNGRAGWIAFYVMGLICMTIINLAFMFQSSFAKFLFVLLGCIVIYHALLFEPVMNYKKKLGYTMQPDGIVKRGLFGSVRTIYYQDLERQIAEGAMDYEETGICIGKGSKKIVFHYEIGDTKAQKHVEKCYDELQTRLHTKLIPYEKEGLEILDKKYVYDKSRKYNTFSLCFALLFLWIFLESGGTKDIGAVVICGILIVPWQYFSLYILAKNASLTQKTYKQLQEFLAKHPGVNLKVKGEYAGWIRFVVMAVLVIGLNCLFILTA